MKTARYKVVKNGNQWSIWNNDMQANQFIYSWDGTKVISQAEADRVCKNLNSK